MSAPVKGRLLLEPAIPVEVGAMALAEELNGRADVEGVVDTAEMVGGTTQPGSLKVVGDTHVAAPATPEAMASEPIAIPVPINKRFAHIMVALLPVGASCPCAAPH
jgi:hypothetical protein